MSIPLITASAANQRLAEGAVLVDIRDTDEHARERIAQARTIPMARMSAAALAAQGNGALIFCCRSGQRTQMNAPALQNACGSREAYLLDGGLNAWKAAGLPVQADASQPLELMRQVQIAAGSLALIGVVLGSTLSPWFYLLSAFVGAGLLFAGVSGFCGMALLLMRMPWNRRRAA